MQRAGDQHAACTGCGTLFQIARISDTTGQVTAMAGRLRLPPLQQAQIRTARAADTVQVHQNQVLRQILRRRLGQPGRVAIPSLEAVDRQHAVARWRVSRLPALRADDRSRTPIATELLDAGGAAKSSIHPGLHRRVLAKGLLDQRTVVAAPADRVEVCKITKEKAEPLAEVAYQRRDITVVAQRTAQPLIGVALPVTGMYREAVG